ncbi:MAG: Panacea domain-containing protein [Hyphomicrobium sp.]
MEFDRYKFETLVLYVIWRAGEIRDFGATKLNKVLWFSDARAYEALGQSVTGETYIREKFGPVPSHIDDVVDSLVRQGQIQRWSERYFDREVRRFSAHQPPDTTCFSASELGLIDWWIKHVAEEHTATSISEKSHDYGWKIASQGEQLPFKSFLAKRIRQPRDGEEVDWARNAADAVTK